MEIKLTRRQKTLIRKAVESGQFRNTEEIIAEALSLWEQRERAGNHALTARYTRWLLAQKGTVDPKIDLEF